MVATKYLVAFSCLLLALKSFQLSGQNIVGKAHYYGITVLLVSGCWRTVSPALPERSSVTYGVNLVLGILGLTVLVEGLGFGSGPGVALGIGSLVLLDAIAGIEQQSGELPTPIRSIATVAAPLLELVWVTLAVVLLMIFVGLVGIQFGVVHFGLGMLLVARYHELSTDGRPRWPAMLTNGQARSTANT